MLMRAPSMLTLAPHSHACTSQPCLELCLSLVSIEGAIAIRLSVSIEGAIAISKQPCVSVYIFLTSLGEGGKLSKMSATPQPLRLERQQVDEARWELQQAGGAAREALRERQLQKIPQRAHPWAYKQGGAHMRPLLEGCKNACKAARWRALEL